MNALKYLINIKRTTSPMLLYIYSHVISSHVKNNNVTGLEIAGRTVTPYRSNRGWTVTREGLPRKKTPMPCLNGSDYAVPCPEGWAWDVHGGFIGRLREI